MTGILCNLLTIFYIILLGRVILSWFPTDPDGPMGQVNSFLFTVTEPILGPLRGVIPPVRLGGMALDMSVLVVFFGLMILQGALC